jgi:hypothetical protein
MRSMRVPRYLAEGGIPGFSSTVAVMVKPNRRAKYGHAS